jgi:hypothetical protein
MPIINFTAADKLASTVIESNWYTAEITNIDGPKPSTSGKSVHFYTDFTLVDGPFATKKLLIVFNTETSSPSVLGSRQYWPHKGMIDAYAAAYAIPVAQVPDALDTDQLLHKPLDIRVDKTIVDGIPMNIIVGFLPAGKGQAQKAPF